MGKIVNLAKAGAKISLVQAIRAPENEQDEPLLLTEEKLAATLKLAGLTQIEPATEFQTEAKDEIKEKLSLQGPFQVVRIKCQTPDFVAGSSRLLSFAKQAGSAKSKPAPQTKAVWSLTDDLDDAEVDLVDDEQLLDEEDKAKPDPESLRGKSA